MNDTIPPPMPAAPAPAPAPAAAPAAPGSLSELLKTPDRYSLGIVGGGDVGPRVALALAAAAAGFALYFFAAGFFAGWRVALLDAAKGAGVALFAFALCLPSLYVFSCVSGATLRAGQIVASGAACLATAGLRLWLAVLAVVALQTVTLLRPMLAAPEKPAEGEAAATAAPSASEKMFFLEHFVRTLDSSPARR